jgi:hypothetical protein
MLGMPYDHYLKISLASYDKLFEMAQERRTTVEPTAEDLINSAYDKWKEDENKVAITDEELFDIIGDERDGNITTEKKIRVKKIIQKQKKKGRPKK